MPRSNQHTPRFAGGLPGRCAPSSDAVLAALPGTSAATRHDADPLDRLTKLGELRAAGVLTEAEFEAQKRRILGG